jgi:hypothetical protein
MAIKTMFRSIAVSASSADGQPKTPVTVELIEHSLVKRWQMALV